VFRNGKKVSLSLKEFDLISYLAEHMGEALHKEKLIEQVWGILNEVEMSTLTVHIRWLREKLEKSPSEPEYIKTVWKVGYMLTDKE
jgi:DNA-binding response OmpR family regulator